jgi:hypothetical protein
MELGLDLDPEPGLADNGDLEHDLAALLVSRADAQSAHREGNDLESWPWRHRIHRSIVRRVHASDHARGYLANLIGRS